jgi:UDP-2,3-diacylglucosamine hydrolase
LSKDKIYFASDFHLGVDARLTSQEREKQLVRWLDMVSVDATELFLVGDIFDFWFEYGTVIPRGFIRLQGKLAELRDGGLPIHFFTGNHDMWMFDYFENEMGIPVYRQPIERTFAGKQFLIGHGDGLGPGDYGYKFIKKVFANPVCQWLFARIHPNFGIRLANFWSGQSRETHLETPGFLGADKEWLITWCEDEIGRGKAMDYFVFGHRHLPINYTLSNQKSRYINLGDWLYYNSYAVFDGNDMQIRFFENPKGEIFGS